MNSRLHLNMDVEAKLSLTDVMLLLLWCVFHRESMENWIRENNLLSTEIPGH
jgi:hypothetical protein